MFVSQIYHLPWTQRESPLKSGNPSDLSGAALHYLSGHLPAAKPSMSSSAGTGPSVSERRGRMKRAAPGSVTLILWSRLLFQLSGVNWSRNLKNGCCFVWAVKRPQFTEVRSLKHSWEQLKVIMRINVIAAEAELAVSSCDAFTDLASMKLLFSGQTALYCYDAFRAIRVQSFCLGVSASWWWRWWWVTLPDCVIFPIYAAVMPNKSFCMSASHQERTKRTKQEVRAVWSYFLMEEILRDCCECNSDKANKTKKHMRSSLIISVC